MARPSCPGGKQHRVVGICVHCDVYHRMQVMVRRWLMESFKRWRKERLTREAKSHRRKDEQPGGRGVGHSLVMPWETQLREEEKRALHVLEVARARVLQCCNAEVLQCCKHCNNAAVLQCCITAVLQCCNAAMLQC